MTLQTLKAFLFNVITIGGGLAAIAWGVLTKFGDAWFAKRFANQLETHKHELASLFSRISKIHEKEFEVLPTAWLKLHQAYGRVYQLCAPLKHFPDFVQMEPSLSDAFIENCKLHAVHKEKLRQAFRCRKE